MNRREDEYNGVDVWQRDSFEAYMLGYSRGKHSLNGDELREEAMRYVYEERTDFHDKGFGSVMAMINVVCNRVMDGWE